MRYGAVLVWMAKRSEIDEFVATTACCARIGPRAVLTDDQAVVFAYCLGRAIPEKLHAAVVTGPRNACEILERMEGRLTRVAQHMAILAAIERHADETLDGCADCAHRMQSPGQ